MSTLPASVQAIVDWLRPSGRISCRSYFLQYFLPTVLLAAVAAMMANQEIFFLSAGILAVGTKKSVERYELQTQPRQENRLY